MYYVIADINERLECERKKYKQLDNYTFDYHNTQTRSRITIYISITNNINNELYNIKFTEDIPIESDKDKDTIWYTSFVDRVINLILRKLFVEEYKGDSFNEEGS